VEKNAPFIPMSLRQGAFGAFTNTKRVRANVVQCWRCVLWQHICMLVNGVQVGIDTT
jgi:hypothetical protein